MEVTKTKYTIPGEDASITRNVNDTVTIQIGDLKLTVSPDVWRFLTKVV